MPSAPALAAQTQLNVIGEAIDAYDFPRALREAYSLRPWVEERADSIPDTLRARLYQYLSELHTKQFLHFDSVSYFTRAAGEKVTEDSPVLLRARQLYVTAMGRTTYDRSWIDIMMTADLGLRLLERHGLAHHPLYAKLLIARGVGGKKYADDLADTAMQRGVWQQNAEIIRSGIRHFSTVHPEWERFGWVELGFLLMRLGVGESGLAAVLDTIGALEATKPSSDSLYVLSYFHFYDDRYAAAYPTAKQLGEAGPHFSYGYTSASDYVKYQSALGLGKLSVALSDSRASARHYGCRLSAIWEGGMDTGPRGCSNYAVSQATIHMERYRVERSTADLDTAFALTQWALGRYEENFRNEQEESALNVMRILGSRMLSVALESAYEMSVREPTPARYNTLFQTMERGKALLLHLDVGEGIADVAQKEVNRNFRERRAEVQEFKNAYTSSGELPYEQLERYGQASREYERLSASYAPKQSERLLTRFANAQNVSYTIGRLQDSLDDGAAVLEFAETNNSLIALYVDRDTAVSYHVPLALLDTALQRFLPQLVSGSGTVLDTTGYFRRANVVYQTLLSPITEELNRCTKLLVAPSTRLHSLPLAALMDHPDRFLIDRMLIRYVPSWGVEVQHQLKRGQQSERVSYGRIAILTHRELSGYFRSLNDLLKPRARFLPSLTDLSRAGDADIVQLSVHARGNPTRLHDNYLYLSDSDSLNGIAIGRQPLDARLVVLAACSTANGFSSPGEGTFSLQRSFHVAGVPDVISSLYDIPAAATAVLLEEFYRRLIAGHSPARALRDAQLMMRRGEISERYALPAFWSGMVVG